MKPITSTIDEHDRGQHDDQSVGDGARGEDDRPQHLVVDDVEPVVEEAEQLVDEVGIAFGRSSVTLRTYRTPYASIHVRPMIPGPPWVPTTGPMSVTMMGYSVGMSLTSASSVATSLAPPLMSASRRSGA